MNVATSYPIVVVIGVVLALFAWLRNRNLGDVRLVAEWADRAVALSAGSIAFDGHPADLFRQTRLLKESSLMPPPIFDISTALAGSHPDRVPGSYRSVPLPVQSILG